VVEGEGAVHLPGARSGRPLTVEITEETGKPVAGAAVTFHLPEDGPGGIFVNGLRTEVVIADSHGRATLHGLVANRNAGRFQVRIVASKEQARAGTVSFQYVAELKNGAATASSPAVRKRWIVVLAAVAGGAVASVAVTRGGGAAASSAPPTTPSAPPVLTVGTPSITVGKP